MITTIVGNYPKVSERTYSTKLIGSITKWQRKLAKEKNEEPKPRFLESISEIVNGLGIDRKRFRKEIYG